MKRIANWLWNLGAAMVTILALIYLLSAIIMSG